VSLFLSSYDRLKSGLGLGKGNRGVPSIIRHRRECSCLDTRASLVAMDILIDAFIVH
jgi:hypothetical protein